MKPAAIIEFEHVTKRYKGVAALDDVTLSISEGAFLTFVGPSGSGKTTALMTLAGFVRPDRGVVRLRGQDIGAMPPERRGFGVVFQGYALFPHMTAAANVAFPLECRGMPRSLISERVRNALDTVQLTGLEDRRPSQLSGGQQQRVAIARALVYEPPILLLDEPLGALDKKLRLEMQAELKSLHRRTGLTFINVTHDQDEALSLSTEIAVLSRGRMAQFGTPGEIYERPASPLVADFIGAANLLPAKVVERAAGLAHLTLGTNRIVHRYGEGDSGEDTVIVVLRPEHLAIGSPAPGANVLTAVVIDTEPIGPVRRTMVEVIGVGRVRVTSPAIRGTHLTPGDQVEIWWYPDSTRLLSVDTSDRSLPSLSFGKGSLQV
jgi:putative spermidine/putrescine transport system ATP-binding protein